MNLLVSFLPIILPFVLLVLLKRSAKVGMSISFLVLLVSAFFIWDMDGMVLLASIVQGLHKALAILIILFGAIFMMNVLQRTGAVNRINHGFNSLTTDMRLQAILIAFLFGAIIEGVAGFGTPAVVVAPLLVALGFRPLAAATLALVSNSVPVPFAAVGTPVQIGLGNISTDPVFLNAVGRYITSIDFFAGLFMPTVVVFMLLFFFSKNSSKRDYLEIAPWTLFIGAVYTTIAFIIVRTLGYEFVTIVSSITTLVIATVSIKFNFLVPKHAWQDAKIETKEIEYSDMPLWQAWLPYGIVILLLILTRTVVPIKDFVLTYIDLSYRTILGYSDINSSLQLLYSPGFILVLSAILAIFIQRSSTKHIASASMASLRTVRGAALALIPTLALVQIFSNSGMNGSGLDSMPIYLATFLGERLNGVWVLLAPFVGELGSFITGSATVSTLTFSPVQYQIAQQYGLNAELILGLQIMGGAAGNMICVHNVVSVSTVVDTEGQEGLIIKKTILPALLYGLLAGLAALLFFT